MDVEFEAAAEEIWRKNEGGQVWTNTRTFPMDSNEKGILADVAACPTGGVAENWTPVGSVPAILQSRSI